MPVYSNDAARAVVFVSLALLVHSSGQVSLCHAALAAVGAMTFCHLVLGAHLP
jgi:ABC-type branched-subunit amino acid transport system permease subunit